jgi:hypothetical protein
MCRSDEGQKGEGMYERCKYGVARMARGKDKPTRLNTVQLFLTGQSLGEVEEKMLRLQAEEKEEWISEEMGVSALARSRCWCS